jgi:hypothetical protein
MPLSMKSSTPYLGILLGPFVAVHICDLPYWNNVDFLPKRQRSLYWNFLAFFPHCRPLADFAYLISKSSHRNCLTLMTSEGRLHITRRRIARVASNSYRAVAHTDSLCDICGHLAGPFSPRALLKSYQHHETSHFSVA